MKARMSIIALAIALAGGASVAQAGAESGFYAGGSVGSASLDFSEEDPDIGEIEFDDDDSAYKVFLGYNIGAVPLVNLAVEGAYVNFGTFGGDIAGFESEIDVDGFTAFGLVGFDLGPIGLFGKVGVLSWDNEISADDFSTDDSGNDPAYGLGAKFQIGSFSLRAEYELFDLDEVDIDMYSVGAAYTF